MNWSAESAIADLLAATEPDSPKVLGLRLSCVNQRAQLAPTIQIWGNSAMPWLKTLQTVPQHETGVTSALVKV